MQIISQEKDPAVGINGFEGVVLEWLLPKKKKSLFTRGSLFFSFAPDCYPTPQWSRQFNVEACFVYGVLG